jgi:neutral ceramidase
LKKFIRIISFIFLAIIFILLCLFEKIDRTPYQETSYYKETMQRLDRLNADSLEKKSLYFKAGWAKESIVPGFHIPMAGYGIRNDFECIHDTLFARAFVFDNGSKKVAIVSLDLLIIPPVLIQRFIKQSPSSDIKIEDIYFSATHTHNSVGGWADKIAGRFLAGKFNEQMVEKLIASIHAAIKKAESNLEESKIGYGQYEASAMVSNRLVHEKGTIDPWLRVIKIQKKSGPVAVLTTFAAHATCLSAKNNCLSGDYPSFLVDSLEKSKRIEFALFCAGAVGSMGPGDLQKSSYDRATAIADSLSDKILSGLDHIEMASGDTISSFFVPLSLREPHLKISNDFRFRPWVFNLILGEQTIGISVLRIGDIVMIGTPCDFSGELVKGFEGVCREKNIHMIITSFNGGYIGYVTDDRHYDLVKPETREMNWYGPYNGAYFTEIITKILRKI